MLASSHRLRDAELFRSAARRGQRQAGAFVVVHSLRVPEKQPFAAGFVVNKAVGNAVVRNRVKRQLRHAAREVLSDLPESQVLVVRALPQAAIANYQELAADLQRCIDRLIR